MKAFFLKGEKRIARGLIPSQLLAVLCLTLVSSCGLDPQNKQDKKAVANNLPDTASLATTPTVTPAAKSNQLNDIRLSFAQNIVTNYWSRNAKELHGAATVAPQKLAVFNKNGQSWIYDSAKNVSEVAEPFLEQIGENDLVFTLPNKVAWTISKDKIVRSEVVGGKVTNFTINLPLPDVDQSNIKVTGVQRNSLILAGKSALKLLLWNGTALTEKSVEYPKGTADFSAKILAADFAISAESQSAWETGYILTSDTFINFKVPADGSAPKLETTQPLSTNGLAGAPKFATVTLRPGTVEIDKVLMVTDSGVFLSGIAGSKKLSWNTDIRPIAEGYCVSCHGAQGAGGFTKANEEASWLGAKRVSISDRVANKSMPPPSSPEGQKLKNSDRDLVVEWLRGSVSGMPTGDEPNPNPGDAAIPTPGPSWDSSVKSIITARCARCHPTYSTWSSFYEDRSSIKLAVTNGTMPKVGSAEATAITQAERNAILNFINGYP